MRGEVRTRLRNRLIVDESRRIIGSKRDYETHSRTSDRRLYPARILARF